MPTRTSDELVDPFDLTCRVGRRLTIDPKTESFNGDAAANRLLTREYRKPFVVPERLW